MIAGYSIVETIIIFILINHKKVSTVNANCFNERGDLGEPFWKSGDRCFPKKHEQQQSMPQGAILATAPATSAD
jgi:hypothetical protein